jgi:hypothetical protein
VVDRRDFVLGTAAADIVYRMRSSSFDKVTLAASVVLVFVGAFWTAGQISAGVLIATPLALACAALLIWRKPRPVVVALFGFAFFAPFDTLARTASGATVTKYLGLLIVLFAIIEVIQRGHIVKPDRALWAWCFYLCWATSSLLWATRGDESLSFLTTLLTLFALYAVVTFLPFTPDESKTILVGAILSGTVISCYSLYISLHGSAESTVRIFNGERRTFLQLPGGSDLADPNHTAAGLLLPIALSVAFIVGARSRVQRTLATIAFALLSVGVYENNSRGAMIALAVMAAYFVARSSHRWILAAGFTLLAAVITLTNNPIINRFTHDDLQGSGRGSIWKVGLLAFKEHWLSGIGIANFPVAYDSGFLRTSQLVFKWHQPGHSIVFSTAVELGLVGVALLATTALAQFTMLRTVPRGPAGVD